MATIKTISAALKLVDAKKENLKKAFEDLQSHSSSLSSFNLTWSDLDSYFSSLHSSLQHKFQILQSQSQSLSPNTPNSTSQFQIPKSPPNSQTLNVNESLDLAPVPARAELISFCEKMDGLGLRKYIMERPKERNTIKAELADALGHAPDAAAMVLGAMEGFYNSTMGHKDIELIAIRRSCVVMLEGLRMVGGEIGGVVREKARELAAEWKGKARRNGGGENGLEGLGFFLLVAAFGVADGFDLGELVDLGVEVARFREGVELIRVIGFGDRISGEGLEFIPFSWTYDFCAVSIFLYIAIFVIACCAYAFCA